MGPCHSRGRADYCGPAVVVAGIGGGDGVNQQVGDLCDWIFLPLSLPSNRMKISINIKKFRKTVRLRNTVWEIKKDPWVTSSWGRREFAEISTQAGSLS